jgi:hypothetical protein
MPVLLFAHRPQRCPFGHSLAVGSPQLVGWQPCICASALEADREGRGMGHLLVVCGGCHADRRESVFYEPPHDIRHRAPIRQDPA